MATKDKCDVTVARCAGVQPGCELTSVQLDVCPVGRCAFAPEYSLSGTFVISPRTLTPQCNARVMFLRRSSVIFVETLCAVPKSPSSSPRNRRPHLHYVACVIRSECQ